MITKVQSLCDNSPYVYLGVVNVSSRLLFYFIYAVDIQFKNRGNQFMVKEIKNCDSIRSLIEHNNSKKIVINHKGEVWELLLTGKS